MNRDLFFYKRINKKIKACEKKPLQSIDRN